MANQNTVYSGNVLTSGVTRNARVGATGNAKQAVPSSSFVNGFGAKTDAYNLHITNVTLNINSHDGTLHVDFNIRNTETVESFFDDITVMNNIKRSKSDAVKKHYAELMTLLALSDEEKDK